MQEHNMKRKGGPHSKECEKPAKVVKTNQICTPTRQSAKIARLERVMKLQENKNRRSSIIHGGLPDSANIHKGQPLLHVKASNSREKAKEARRHRKRIMQAKKLAQISTKEGEMIGQAGNTMR
ncbi:uncharacterized protein [Triticum aestivum]|uniref:uncharacterized protein n=1 Tax=Triticum aestivum TaxID=4565 RepID=UPI001D005170|nr:uncharacterized protein LOC123079729 [Triticum aestivum]